MKSQKEIRVSVILEMLLKKWKLLVVGVLVCGILFGGYSYIRSYRAIQEQQVVDKEVIEDNKQEIGNETEESITEEYLQEKLTDIQKNNVDVTVLYKDFYDSHKEYLDNSIIMKMNPNAIYKAEIVFRIAAEDLEKTYNLQKMYAELLDGEELTSWLNKKMNINSSHTNEIISVDKMNNNVITGSDIIAITIIHYDETQCENTMDLIGEYVVEKGSELKTYVGEHEVQTISSVISKVADDNILRLQENNRSELSKLLSEVIGREKNFSEAEWDYYNYRLTGKIDEEITKEDADTIKRPVIERPNISWVSVVCGMFLGCALYCIFIVMKCMLNKKMLKSDRFDELYRIAHFEALKEKQNEINTEVLSAMLTVAVKKRNCKNAYLLGVELDEKAIAVCKEIGKMLEDSGIRSGVFTDLLANPKEIESLLDVDCIVVFAQAEKTSYQSVEKALEYLEGQEVIIIGGVNINYI